MNPTSDGRKWRLDVGFTGEVAKDLVLARDRWQFRAMPHDLPHDVMALLKSGSGVFTISEAIAGGVSARRVEHLARLGALSRVGRGVYASTAELAETDVWHAHAIRTRGYLLACEHLTLAAGWSGVAVRGLRTLGRPPDLPAVVQPQPGARTGVVRTTYAVTRRIQLDQRYFGHYADCPVVDRAWLVVDLARTAPRRSALVVADSALASGTTDRGLRNALTAVRRWRGAGAAEWVVSHADGRSESALETLGRYCCIAHGLPVPISNAWIGDGQPKIRVDHLWPRHGVVAEADGALKYNDAAAPADIVAAEKERQWFLERVLGLDVVRYNWDLAFHRPDQLAERFSQVLAGHPRRSDPVPWWPIQSWRIPPERA